MVIQNTRMVPVLGFLFLFCFSSIAWGDQEEAIRHADAVQTLINDGEYENALARVDVALKSNSKDPRLLLQRGLILVQLDRLDDAEKHYKKLKWRIKNNPEPANNLAMVYRLQGEYDKAIDLFRSTIRSYPDYRQAYVNLGDTYVEMANIEYAVGYAKFPDSALLESKADTSLRFNEIALSNTPAERRRQLAEKQRAEQALAKLETIDNAEASALGDPTERIVSTLQSWITAWSEQDVDTYLGHYSKEFNPGNATSLAQWIGQQREAISSAEYIALNLDEIKVSQINANRAIVTFIQSYESNLVELRSRKSLTFQRYEDDRWLITKEENRLL